MNSQYQKLQIQCPICSSEHIIRVYEFNDSYKCPITGGIFNTNSISTMKVLDVAIEGYGELFPLSANSTKENQKPIIDLGSNEVQVIVPIKHHTPAKNSDSYDVTFDDNNEAVKRPTPNANTMEDFYNVEATMDGSDHKVKRPPTNMEDLYNVEATMDGSDHRVKRPPTNMEDLYNIEATMDDSDHTVKRSEPKNINDFYEAEATKSNKTVKHPPANMEDLYNVEATMDGSDHTVKRSEPKDINDLYEAEATIESNKVCDLDATVDGQENKAVRLKKIGKYKIIHKISSGAFGIVYKAFDTVLQRYVAIKMSSCQLEEKAWQLFKKEAEILARLNHPNIVQVYDFGIENGLSYIVMEYIEGQSICAFALETKKQVSKEEFYTDICKHFAELSDALIDLHKENIYHQDIKPQNVMISNKYAKFVDFGLASVGNATATHFSGTIKYSPPEKLDMGFKPGAISDIYSLGAVLYEALTNRRVISGNNFKEIVNNIQNSKITFSPDDHVDKSLQNICIKCLHKQSSQRYQNAQELHLALVTCAANINKVSSYPYLYLADNKKSKVLFPLAKRKNYIGRSFNNDLVIHGGTISRVHGVIVVEPDQVYIENLSQKNIINVSNNRVKYQEKRVLKNADYIKFSEHIFYFVELTKEAT